MRILIAAAISLTCWLAFPLAAPCAVASAEPAATAADQVAPTALGWVMGRAYDAQTGVPLEAALVTVQQDGEFAIAERSSSKTDRSGQYRCSAKLGRTASKVEFGRLLNTGLVGLLSGGAKKETRRIDVAQLNVRVTKDGFHPFEGTVQARDVNAQTFTIHMEPILLSRANSADASTVATGWSAVRILKVAATPAVVRPGGRSTVTVELECPSIAKTADIVVECRASVFGKQRLSPEKERTADNVLAFAGAVTISKSAKAVADRITVFARAPFDLGTDTWEGTAIFVAATAADERAAALRQQAYTFAAADQNVEAASVLSELCALPAADVQDFQLLADVSEKLHDYDRAVTALERVVALTPEKSRLVPTAQYANALVLSGRSDRVLREIVPQVDAIKEPERPKRVPVGLMVAIGKAYVASGKLDEAEAVNAQLTRFPGATGNEGAREFRRSLRLAQAEAAVAARPSDAAAWADHGRVLMDLGRWEEAVEKLRKAIALDPGLPSVQWDLGYALLQIGGATADTAESFDQALANAEQAVQVAPGQQKTKDFFAWHRLGVLLYRGACRQREVKGPAAAATLARSEEMLVEAIRCGHAGADVSQGGYSYAVGYTSPKVVAISGFAYAEANADFVLVNALAAAAKHPDDYLAHFNVATALIDLGQWDLAAAALDKTLGLRPGFLDAMCASAVVAMHSGDTSKAIGLLQDVVKTNPRHPEAHQTLAELYTEQGDVAAAAACLAAHAQYYGRGR